MSKKGYLVISRKTGERIKVGHDVEILISHIDRQHDKVDVAIRAPVNQKITRLGTHIEEGALRDGHQNRHQRKPQGR